MDSQNLFERYLVAVPPEEDPESILETLLALHAQPVLQRVVRRRLASLYTPATAADLAAEAMVELLGRMRTMREAAAERADFPFEAMAAGVAANTVHRFFARTFPERGRLRKRLRYVVETDRRFRIWTDAEGRAICGLASASGGGPVASAADVERCLNGLRERPVAVDPLSRLVLELLRGVRLPVELSRLTGMAAELTGIREPVWSDLGENSEVEWPDPAPSVEKRLELRQRLEQLWREIQQLVPGQRAALLLSARAAGGSAAWLLVDLGLVAFDTLAQALGLNAGELAEVWNRLPLEDLEIASRLGLLRQQVINARAAARTRLARRESRAAAANIGG